LAWEESMHIKVELHPDVAWFVRHRCTQREVDEFYRLLEALRAEPIRHSEMVVEPRLRRYALRLFRFGVNLAVFEYNAAKNRIRVLECRKAKPIIRRNGGDAGEP